MISKYNFERNFYPLRDQLGISLLVVFYYFCKTRVHYGSVKQTAVTSNKGFVSTKSSLVELSNRLHA